MQPLYRKESRIIRFTLALLLAFLTGSFGYYSIEVLYRGHSHISMWLCGGLAFLGIFLIEWRYSPSHLYWRALFSALLVTLLELLFGCIVNLWLGLGVWDYSGVPLNLLGQICLPYSLVWLALFLPASKLAALIRVAVGIPCVTPDKDSPREAPQSR